MDYVDQPPVSPPAPVMAANSAPIMPASPAKHHWLWAVLMVIILIAGALWWLLFRDTSMHASSGFVGRTAPTVQGLNSVVTTNGSCIKNYRLQPGGRTANGTQHYALTITLVGDPIDQTELFTTLNAAQCNTELVAIHATVAPLVDTKTTPDVLSTAYRTKSGKLLFLP